MLSKEALQYIHRLELKTRKNVTSLFSGQYRSVFRGQGMEFSDLRSYEYGDDTKNINWNVTARTGIPYIKLFNEERELNLMIMVDISGSGLFGSKTKTKNETAAETAAFLAMAAGIQNDNLGLILFTDKIEHYVPPKRGDTHMLRIIRDILNVASTSKKTSLDTALRFCNKVMKKRAIVFIVSDFIDDGFENSLGNLSKRHDVIAVLALDERELHLPDVGRVLLEDSETGKITEIDTSDYNLREMMNKAASERLENITSSITSRGADIIKIKTDESCYMPLIEFFRTREKRRRH